MSVKSKIGRRLMWGLGAVSLVAQPLSTAHAELALSQLVVQLQPGKKAREDIEVLNNSSERAYVVVEPSEIVEPGQAGERRHQEPDPQRRGLLVAPTRMILEPGQRKLIRVSTLGTASAQERVYRVTVKPVAGELQAETDGLKILVGYDVLVLVRPNSARGNVLAERTPNELRFRNAGNASVELADGRQCDAGPTSCTALPGKRLYSGAQWSVPVRAGYPVEYTVISAEKTARTKF